MATNSIADSTYFNGTGPTISTIDECVPTSWNQSHHSLTMLNHAEPPKRTFIVPCHQRKNRGGNFLSELVQTNYKFPPEGFLVNRTLERRRVRLRQSFDAARPACALARPEFWDWRTVASDQLM
jgi:hypothetical protein